MDLGGVVNRHFQQTKNDMYQNSGYCDSRNNKQILILDIQGGGMTDTTTAFDGSTPAKGELHEPLIIDTLSDVYLDNFTTCEAVANSTSVESRSFILSIDQFQIKSNSNRSQYFNKIVIPNEDSTGGANSHKIHKGRKMNYICSINPQKLTKLSGKLTNFAGDNAIADGDNSGFICEFIIVARN